MCDSNVLIVFYFLNATAFIALKVEGECGCMREWVSPSYITIYVGICTSRDTLMLLTRCTWQTHVPTMPNYRSRNHVIMSQRNVLWHISASVVYRSVVRSKCCHISSISSSARTCGIFFCFFTDFLSFFSYGTASGVWLCEFLQFNHLCKHKKVILIGRLKHLGWLCYA